MLAVLMLNQNFNEKRIPIQKGQNYCRTCLAEDNLLYLFNSNDPNNMIKSQKLQLATGLRITADDGLSQKICSNCVNVIKIAVSFRKISHIANEKLLKLSQMKNVRKARNCKPFSKQVRVKKNKGQLKNIKVKEELDYNADYEGDDFQNDGVSSPINDVMLQEECKLEKVDKVGVDLNDTQPSMLSTEESPPKFSLRIPKGPPYKCSTCSKEFRMVATYKAHMRFHISYWICESCGKRCRNNNQLLEHKRAKHGLGKIHKCAFCEYTSATKEALTIHERTHTGERPYICDHCGASFHRRSNLVQHIAIHLPVKNFQCHLCPKREKSRKILQVHISKVHREKRYKYICPICADTFTRPGNVRQHLSRSHGVHRSDQGTIDKTRIALK